MSTKEMQLVERVRDVFSEGDKDYILFIEDIKKIQDENGCKEVTLENYLSYVRKDSTRLLSKVDWYILGLKYPSVFNMSEYGCYNLLFCSKWYKEKRATKPQYGYLYWSKTKKHKKVVQNVTNKLSRINYHLIFTDLDCFKGELTDTYRVGLNISNMFKVVTDCLTLFCGMNPEIPKNKFLRSLRKYCNYGCINEENNDTSDVLDYDDLVKILDTFFSWYYEEILYKVIGVIDVEDKFVSLYDLGFSKDAVLTVLSEYDKLWLHVLLQIKKFYKESGRLYYPVEDRHLYKWTSNTMVHLRGGKLSDVRYRLLQKYFPEMPDLYSKNSQRFRVSKEEVLSKGKGSVSEVVKTVEELSLKELESRINCTVRGIVWFKNYQVVKEFYNKNGRFINASDIEYAVYLTWCRNQVYIFARDSYDRERLLYIEKDFPDFYKYVISGTVRQENSGKNSKGSHKMYSNEDKYSTELSDVLSWKLTDEDLGSLFDSNIYSINDYIEMLKGFGRNYLPTEKDWIVLGYKHPQSFKDCLFGAYRLLFYAELDSFDCFKGECDNGDFVCGCVKKVLSDYNNPYFFFDVKSFSRKHIGLNMSILNTEVNAYLKSSELNILEIQLHLKGKLKELLRDVLGVGINVFNGETLMSTSDVKRKYGLDDYTLDDILTKVSKSCQSVILNNVFGIKASSRFVSCSTRL